MNVVKCIPSNNISDHRVNSMFEKKGNDLVISTHGSSEPPSVPVGITTADIASVKKLFDNRDVSIHTRMIQASGANLAHIRAIHIIMKPKLQKIQRHVSVAISARNQQSLVIIQTRRISGDTVSFT
jgi:hypothetical protein